MKKIVITAPRPKEILEGSADDFPEHYRFPPQVIIRLCYVEHRADFLKGAEFEVSGYGSLFTKGRSIRFEMEDSYWKEKGYPSNCFEGKW